MSSKERLELMSIGRRISYLNRCITVVNLLNEYETETSVRCRVFEKHIKPVMNISYVTFNNMLNEKNPDKELLELTAKIKRLKNPQIKEVIKEKVLVNDGGW